MTESIMDQLEGQATEQARVRAVEAVRRLGAENADEVVEYLSTFEPVQQMAANQREYAQKIKRIRENVALNDSERLEAAAKAATEAQERRQELEEELAAQTRQRTDALERTLYGMPADASGYRQALLGLANAPKDQLDTLADTARAAGDMTLLRAIRTTAATKGFGSLVAKTVALDASAEAAAAYTEREKLKTSGALEAISGAYAPQPVTEAQLKPPAHVVEQAAYARAQQEAAGRRVLSGGGGIVDGNHPGKVRRQVGRR